MMKSSLTCVLGLLVLISVGTLAAQSAQSEDRYATGTVVSSSSSSLVIRTEAGDQMTFNLNSQTVLPSQLQAGAKVDVRYHDEGGMYHAAEVQAIGSTTEPA